MKANELLLAALVASALVVPSETFAQDKSAARELRTFRGGEEIAPLLQTQNRAPAAAHAERRLRPFARRRASTLRPLWVAMRARKPWRRLRTRRLG